MKSYWVVEQNVFSERKFKIIECNTFNSAGLYKCDTTKIVKAINELLGK